MPVLIEVGVQHLSSAARHYTKALEFQRGNIYAANGLGAVAGSLGQLDAARTMLSQLRESAALASGFVEVPDVRYPPRCYTIKRSQRSAMRAVVCSLGWSGNSCIGFLLHLRGAVALSVSPTAMSSIVQYSQASSQ